MCLLHYYFVLVFLLHLVYLVALHSTVDGELKNQYIKGIRTEFRAIPVIGAARQWHQFACMASYYDPNHV